MIIEWATGSFVIVWAVTVRASTCQKSLSFVNDGFQQIVVDPEISEATRLVKVHGIIRRQS